MGNNPRIEPPITSYCVGIMLDRRVSEEPLQTRSESKEILLLFLALGSERNQR